MTDFARSIETGLDIGMRSLDGPRTESQAEGSHNVNMAGEMATEQKRSLMALYNNKICISCFFIQTFTTRP